MSWLDLFKRNRGDATEQRAEGFTDIAMGVRADWIMGRQGIAELTGAVQGCVSLWEQGLSIAETENRLLTPQMLALTARSLGIRGESVWVIDGNRLIPVDEFDLTTRAAKPRAYRVTIPDTGGGYSTTVLADEILHFTIGANTLAPWRGTAPLRRAQLSASLLHAVEDALGEVFTNAPIGSQITPMPETAPGDNDKLAASFRGKRGRVLLRESTNVQAAGGPAPASDWKPSDLTPSLKDSMAIESWREARHAIMHAFGVLPALISAQATGPVVREAQRHLAQWTLQPIATAIAAEASAKLDTPTIIEVSKPLQAYDAGGRARALTGVVQALAAAQQAGLSDDQVNKAMQFSGVVDP